eukprot:scaffold1259_cov501-Pavlova_lutheri.AAC.1
MHQNLHWVCTTRANSLQPWPNYTTSWGIQIMCWNAPPLLLTYKLIWNRSPIGLVSQCWKTCPTTVPKRAHDCAGLLSQVNEEMRWTSPSFPLLGKTAWMMGREYPWTQYISPAPNAQR